MSSFLIGGGRDDDGVTASHGPFVAAAAAHRPGAPIAVLVLDEGEETDVARWVQNLVRAGARAAPRPIVVSPERPPTAADVEATAGVYVAGGLTPGYRDALTADRAWLDAVREDAMPYAGFSAGAAVAPARALVGGWRARAGDAEVAVCDDGAGEDLELVTVADGLGLVDLVVDVHCAQWGTLTRLVHALRGEPGRAGAGIDEHTALEVAADGALRVHGAGAVYLVGADRRIDVLGPGDARA